MPKRILVVESDVMVRNILIKMLVRQRYEVLESSGVQEALNLLGMFESPLHLLIADSSLMSAPGQRFADQLLNSRPGLRFLQISPELRRKLGRQAVPLSEAGVSYLAARAKEILEAPPAK